MTNTASDPHDQIRRAQNRRRAVELGRSGLDPASIARDLQMPLFVVKIALRKAKVPFHPPRVIAEPVAATKPAPPATSALLPKRGPGRPRKILAPGVTPPRRGPGRPRKVQPSAESVVDMPRRGPGRPRKHPLPEVPPPKKPPTVDPRATLIAKRFSEFQSVAAVAKGLKLPAHIVRYEIKKLPKDQLAAWKDLIRMRRELSRL